MKHPSLNILHLIDGEGIGLGAHLLCAVVLVFSINIFEKHSVCAGIVAHFNARLSHLFNSLKAIVAHLCNQFKRHTLWQRIKGISKIKRGTTGHIDGLAWRDNFVASDVSDAANIFHQQCFLNVYQRCCK